MGYPALHINNFLAYRNSAGYPALCTQVNYGPRDIPQFGFKGLKANWLKPNHHQVNSYWHCQWQNTIDTSQAVSYHYDELHDADLIMMTIFSSCLSMSIWAPVVLAIESNWVNLLPTPNAGIITFLHLQQLQQHTLITSLYPATAWNSLQIFTNYTSSGSRNGQKALLNIW